MTRGASLIGPRDATADMLALRATVELHGADAIEALQRRSHILVENEVGVDVVATQISAHPHDRYVSGVPPPHPDLVHLVGQLRHHPVHAIPHLGVSLLHVDAGTETDVGGTAVTSARRSTVIDTGDRRQALFHRTGDLFLHFDSCSVRVGGCAGRRCCPPRGGRGAP